MPKVLATDLDGTLLYPRPNRTIVPKKNIVFLRRWVDEGNRLVVISSRGQIFMEKLMKEIQRPFDYIACTSSLISIDGKIVKDVWMDNKELETILGKINKKYKPKAYLLTTASHPLIIRNNSIASKFLANFYKITWYAQKKAKEEFILDNDLFDKEIKEGKPYKVMIFFGVGRNKKELSKAINTGIREQFPDVESSWTSIVNELTPKGCSKGSGLEFYCKYLNIKHSDVYVVGDSGNDITMFKLFYENSFVMKKAYPSVKKYAKNCISRVYKLEKYLLPKGEK